MKPLQLLDGLTPPTPDAIQAARVAAGMGQPEAAALVGLGSGQRWSEYERGARNIDAARWALFLLATGQHPRARLAGA
jgi:hypothetical protein